MNFFSHCLSSLPNIPAILGRVKGYPIHGSNSDQDVSGPLDSRFDWVAGSRPRLGNGPERKQQIDPFNWQKVDLKTRKEKQ
jgi:hypothetical protein